MSTSSVSCLQARASLTCLCDWPGKRMLAHLRVACLFSSHACVCTQVKLSHLEAVSTEKPRPSCEVLLDGNNTPALAQALHYLQVQICMDVGMLIVA